MAGRLKSKRTQYNGQGNGKNVFSLTSEHKIINSCTRHASLSNDITHQNTRFHWSLLKSPGNLTLHYVALHYTFHTAIENFSACCNTFRGIKLAASQASRFRSACSLAMISDDPIHAIRKQDKGINSDLGNVVIYKTH